MGKTLATTLFALLLSLTAASVNAQSVQGESAFEVSPAQSLVVHRDARLGRILKIVGWSTLGGSYLSSAVFGAAMLSDVEEAYWLFVPLVGPSVMGTMVISQSLASNTWLDPIIKPLGVLIGLCFWAETLLQLGGLAVAVAGHSLSAHSRREARSRSFTVRPYGSHEGLGLSFAGRF